MISKLILFMLPALAFAKIKIELFGNFDPSLADMRVVCSGSETHFISDEEIRKFGVTEDNLKYSAMQQFDEKPKFVYTHNPYFFGDMYQINNWTQVTTTVNPKSAKILKVSVEPQIVVQEMFKNNSTVPVTYNVDVSHVVNTAVSSSWINSTGLNVDTDLTYVFAVDLLNSGGVMSMSFTSPWGADTHMKQTMYTGSASTVAVPVQPGEMVTAEFHAFTGTVSLAMDYVASLAGDAVAHYDPEYRGNKFWKLPVTKAMSMAGLADHMTAQEVMHINCRSNSRVTISNKVDSVKVTEVVV